MDLTKKIDELIALYEEREDPPSDEELAMIDGLYKELKISKQRQKELQDKTMVEKLEEIAEATTKSKELPEDITEQITSALAKLVLPTPIVNVAASPAPIVNVPAPKVEVNVPKQPPFPKIPAPIVNIPDTVSINKPSWLAGLINLKPITDKLKEIKNSIVFPIITFPTDADNAISVRLSDGENFYKAVGGMINAIGSSFPFQNSSKNNQPALVDKDGKLYVSMPNTDYSLDVARGLITNITSVNKFGKAPSGVQTTATDIWSRADATPTQQIWLAPTAARIHAIVSSSINDDGSPIGTGARTIRIYGLKTWDLAETTEDITLDGTTPVNTVNSYVIIHRMKVLTCGASGPNVGTISATAAAPDSTVTAVIIAGEGQTEMAIYGVPSIQSFYMTRWGAAMGKEITAQTIEFTLKVNESPNMHPTGFLLKNDLNTLSTGTSAGQMHFDNPVKYAGPCIIKVQGASSKADVDAKSGFDGYLVTN